MKVKVKEGKVKADLQDWEKGEKLLKDLMEEFGISEQDDAEFVEEEEEEEGAEKVLFGSKADDFFYLVEEGEDPSNYTLVNAEGTEVYSPEADTMTIEDFIYDAATKLDLDSISWDILTRYGILAEAEYEEEVPEELEKEEAEEEIPETE